MQNMILEKPLLRPHGKYKGTGGLASRTAKCWPATVLLILSALAVRHTHIPFRVQEGLLDRAGHMTKQC